VRGSGTEPKIKYYLFAQRNPQGVRFTSEELASTKPEVAAKLNALWDWLQVDAHRRVAAG
jgi:phosphomannomutase